ncbi:hypothetical protein ARMGADRAFT_1068119 [Armillaria gallica]|uniref:Uncharacterized protein n=1 Tax=Armillaria gallica TaxID=47427 RepID=A0A2H3CML4_ARMGA|nr:hypothetical protein ARMGADRAFT_1068119 [Armillaria gallica]
MIGSSEIAVAANQLVDSVNTLHGLSQDNVSLLSLLFYGLMYELTSSSAFLHLGQRLKSSCMCGIRRIAYGAGISCCWQVRHFIIGGHTNTERSFLLMIRRQIQVDVLEELASQENTHLLVCVQTAPPPRTDPKKRIRPSLYTQESELCASTHTTPHTTKIQSEKKCNNRYHMGNPTFVKNTYTTPLELKPGFKLQV